MLPDPRCAAVRGCFNDLPRPFDAERLHRQHILITGGTGFLGYWILSLIDVLHQEGISVSASIVSRDPNAFLAKAPYFKHAAWLDWITGDVKNFHMNGSAAWLIHAATDTNAKAHQNPLAIIEDVVLGTRHALNIATAKGVTRALYVSSGAVYGSQPIHKNSFCETSAHACDPTHPASAYGEAKRMAEQWCVQHGRMHKMTIPIARCFAFVGAGLPLNGHFAIGNFIADALAKRSIKINGDGTPVRSYLYGADMAIWLMTCLLNGQHGRAYNVGSDEATTLANLATQVNIALNNSSGITVMSPSIDVTERHRYLPDVQRAVTELGLNIWTSLDKAIQLTAHSAVTTSA